MTENFLLSFVPGSSILFTYGDLVQKRPVITEKMTQAVMPCQSELPFLGIGNAAGSLLLVHIDHQNDHYCLMMLQNQ